MVYYTNMKTINHPKYRTGSIVHDYFSTENLQLFPERFVIIGFIAADGCISDTASGQHRLCFNICQKDKIVLDIINRELSNSTRKLYFNKLTKSYMWYIPSDKICDDLSNFNILPRKSLNYDLPILNIDQMSYFLRGYFYGDGCIMKSNKYGSRGYSLVTSHPFSKSLKLFLESNNIIDVCKIYPLSCKNVVQIHIKGRQGGKLSKFIFKNDKMILLPRKHIKMDEIIYLSHWQDYEKELLLKTSIDEFCQITGRSISSAKTMKYKISTS